MIRVLIGLVVFLGAVVGAVLVVPSFINWNSYKTEIASLVREQLGRDVVIDGDLSLSLLPFPQVKVQSLRLANVPHGASPVMVEAAAVRGDLAWAPLLSGEFQVTALVLDRPVVILERYADGEVNWQFAPSGETPAPADGAGTAIAFHSIRINQGTIVYRDGTEDRFRLDQTDAVLSADSLVGPFEGQVSATVAGRGLVLDGRLGEISDLQATPLSATLSLADGDASLTLAGGLDLSTSLIFSGGVEGRADRLETLLDPSTGLAGPLIGDPVSFKAQVLADGPTAEFKDIDLMVGDRTVSGELGLAIGKLVQIDTDLSISRLAIDDLLPLFKSGAAEGAQSASSGLSSLTLPDLPMGIRATANVAVNVIDYRDRIVRDTKFRAVLGDEELILNQVTAQLPNAGDFSLIGTYRTKEAPKFDGVLQFSSTDLRGMLAWLGEEPQGVDASHLRNLTLDTRVVLEPHQVQLIDVSANFDRSALGGGLTLLLREKPAFGLSATIDRLNLDAYLAAAEALSAEDSAMAEAGDPLTVLSMFDANLQLEVGELTHLKKTYKRLSLDGTVQSGTFVARRLAFGDVAGLSGNLSGSLTGPISSPAVKARLDVTSRDMAETLPALGLAVPDGFSAAGPVRLFGSVETKDSEVLPDLTIEVLGGRLQVAGTVLPVLPVPDISLRVDLDHEQGRRLLALAGFGQIDVPLEKMRLQGTIETADPGYDVAMTVQALEATAAFTGRVDPLAGGGMANGDLVFNHSEMRKLATLLAPGYAPRTESFGPVRLAAKLSRAEDVTTLEELVATVGDRRLQGRISLDQSKPRPQIDMDLTSPELVIDDWLPADVATPSSAVPVPTAGPGPDGWSRERIDLDVLQTLDGDLTFSAGRLAFGQQRLNDAALSATLREGILRLQELAGRLYGGDFTLSGSVDGNGAPIVEMAGGVEGADLGAVALAAGEDENRLSGTINLDYDLETQGDTEFDLVSNLGGAGLIVVTDGVVNGLDLPSVSEKLKSLNRATDFVILAQKAFSGGKTPFSRLEASFVAEKGAIKTQDAVLVSDSASGAATGTVDLPRSSIESQAEFRLVEHPNAPPFGVRLTGPLSEPRQIFQFDEIQAYILSRGLGSIINQLAPKNTGDNVGPEVTPAPAEPVTPAIPVRPLENLLRGLTGQRD